MSSTLIELICGVVRNTLGGSQKSAQRRKLERRGLRVESLEERQLLTINSIGLMDVQDDQNYLSCNGTDTEWHYQEGKEAIVGTAMTVLQNAEGEVKIKLSAENTGEGPFRWSITQDTTNWSWVEGSDVSNNNVLQSVLTWKQGDNATAVRSFDIVFWEDVNNDGVADEGEESQTLTVNIQWANVSLCVNQPVTGSEEPATLAYTGTQWTDLMVLTKYGFNVGHSYFDIRGGELGTNTALPNFTDYANKSWGYSAVIEENAVPTQVLKTGNYIGTGILQNETSLTTDVYQTFTLSKISDLNNLLDFTKATQETPGNYVLKTEGELVEHQCTTVALEALEAAGINFNLPPQETTIDVPENLLQQLTLVWQIPEAKAAFQGFAPYMYDIFDKQGMDSTIPYKGNSPGYVGQNVVDNGGVTGQFTASNAPIVSNVTALTTPIVVTGAVTSETIQLYWDTITPVVGTDTVSTEPVSYTIRYMASTDPLDWTDAEQIKTSKTAYNMGELETLDSGTKYVFQVKATQLVDGVLVESDWSAIVDETTLVALDAPVLDVGAVTAQSITVNWEAIKNADAYIVEYKLETASDWTSSDELTATSFTVPGEPLTNNTTYVFRVKALGDGVTYEESGWSEELSVMTTETQLAAPVLAEGQNTTTSITVNWATVEYADNYIIQYRVKGNADWTSSDPLTETSYTVTIPEPSEGVTYEFRAKAYPEIDIEYLPSDWSAIVESTSLTSLATPVLTAGTVTSSSVNLSWTSEDADDADGYRLEYKLSAENGWTNTIDLPATPLSYTVDGLASGVSYDFRVIALDTTNPEHNSEPGYVLNVFTIGVPTWNTDDTLYTDYILDASTDNNNTATLYGVLADGTQVSLGAFANIGEDGVATITGKANVAENLIVTDNAMELLGTINFNGGKGAQDTFVIEGCDDIDEYTISSSSQTITTPIYSDNPYQSILDHYGRIFGVNSSIYNCISQALNRAWSCIQQHVVTTSIQTNSVALTDGATANFNGARQITINANAGDDRFNIVNLGTAYVLNGGAGNDTLDFSGTSRISIDMGSTSVQNAVPGQCGTIQLNNDIESVIGTAGADRIVGSSTGTNITGNGGSDCITLNGGTSQANLTGCGQSVYVRGNGDYEITIENADNSVINTLGAASTATVNATVNGQHISYLGDSATDRPVLTGDHSMIRTGAGDDLITVTGSHNTICAGAGNDSVFLGAGSDNNFVYAKSGDDFIDAEDTTGTNFFFAGAGNDIILGGAGDDYIYGMTGTNILIGHGGADRIFGGCGRTLLVASTTSNMEDDNIVIDLNALQNAWVDNDLDTTREILGNASISDNARDRLFRSAAFGNLFYANSSDGDFVKVLTFNPFNDLFID